MQQHYTNCAEIGYHGSAHGSRGLYKLLFDSLLRPTTPSSHLTPEFSPAQIIFPLLPSTMQFLSTILSLGFVASAFAQTLIISPADGSSVRAGQTVNVTVQEDVRMAPHVILYFCIPYIFMVTISNHFAGC